MKGLAFDVERVHGLVVHFAARFVRARIQLGMDLAAPAGLRMGDTLHHRFKRLQRAAPPMDADRTEQLVFDRIPFAGPGLRDPQFLPLEKLESPWFLNFCLSFLAEVAAKRRGAINDTGLVPI